MFGFRKRPTTTTQPATETRASDLASPEEWLSLLFGATPTMAGVSVTPQNAMRSTPVRAAVEAIAETVGGLPCEIHAKALSGALSPATSHPAFALLHDHANDWTPAPALIEQVTRDACLHGNGYVHIGRDGESIPRELIRLDPASISVTQDPATLEPVYRQSDAANQRIIPRSDLLHIRAPSVDGVSGASPVQQCRDAIALTIAMQGHASRLFGRGGRPSGVLKFPNRLGAETIKRMKASWQSAHGGENSGGTAILEEGGEFQPIAFKSTDAQFIELWTLAIIEIARVFRVPPSLIFELGRATWSNSAEMGSSFLRFTISRWLRTWEGEISLKLIGRENADRYHVEFDTDDLLRADLAARANAYSLLIASRVYCPNDARRLENLPPYDGGDKFENPNTTTTKTPNSGDLNSGGGNG